MKCEGNVLESRFSVQRDLLFGDDLEWGTFKLRLINIRSPRTNRKSLSFQSFLVPRSFEGVNSD